MFINFQVAGKLYSKVFIGGINDGNVSQGIVKALLSLKKC